MPSQNQPNKQRQQMDRYLESQGLLNYQTKGMSQAQIAAKYKAAGVGVNQNWFSQNYKGASQGQQQGPNFEPPKARGQAVPFNANPNGFTTMPNFGTPQNPTSPIAYEFVQNGLAVKVKLPQPVRTPGTGATNAQALRGETNWTDIFVDERKSILKDPTFYKDNKITQYPMWMQSQIIADPSFDWTQVPKWQRPYFELSSRPAAMGAVQGGIMALGASGPVGAVAAAGVGAVLGAFAGWSGYDQNKEAWQQGDNKFTWNAQQIKDAGKGAFGYLNFLAEFAEKSIGTTAQVISAASDPNKKVVDYLNKDTFNSSASFFEAITPALQAAAQTGKGRLEWTDAVRVLTPALFEGGAIIDLLRNPEKYKGEERYLGAALPVELSQSWTERLDAARAEIASGRNYREVATEFQTGIMAQIGDMAGQGIADPLNAFGRVTSGAGKLISDATGNKIAAEAFTNTDGLREASLKYKTLVQTGEAAKIDPTFDAAKLNTFERWAAGVNKEGQVKAGGVLSGGRGLLDPAPTSNKAADFVRMLGTETPQSRAETGATMFSRNVGQIISMFTTPEEAVGYIKRIAGGDNTAWRDMGSAIGNSPEWYTIQPALKNFVTTKLEGIQKAWETGAVNRDALNRIADVLGEKPGQLLDDWAARGTHEQDFARIIERARQAGTPEAKALLADVDAKNFTAATLQQIVDIFHGEGSLPYDPAQWKYMMYSELTDHFQTWAADKLALDKSPEAKSAFFRTVGILKAAQSILLLGANPGYAIQNGLSGMVHLAATGIYGSMTPKQMGDWITRWETPIPRVDEGVGMGGIVDVKKSNAISDAGKGTGPLTDVKQTLGKISRGMPMSKLSSWFESRNSTRGYVTAMRQFWGNSWRRGVGFREMPKELTGVIRQMGIDPNTIYAAIEAGVNQKEIEAALFGQYQGVKAQSLIHDAAKAAGVTAADAADMLNKIGITDTLDTYLAKADTPEKVTAAFGRAERQVQDWLDMRTAEELKGRAEDVKNRVGMEGAAAGLDVAHRANNEFIDAWLDHYARFGDLFEGLDAIDPAMRNKAFEEAYRQSDENFRRVYARHGANYQGIFDVWGLSGDADATRVLQSISETNVAMKAAYDFMRAERRGLFESLDEAQITPTAEQWATSTKRIDAAFKKAFDTKHNAEVRQGQALAAIYEKLHGPAAGEAARLWWDDVTKFSEQIVKDEQDFRKSIDRARSMGADRDQIAAAKKKYYSEKKIGMIAELERLNQEGIARLERVIKNGGSADPTATPAPTSPTPTEPSAPASKAPTAKQKREAEAAEVRAMERAAEERRIAEQQARRQAEASVWDIAEKYWGNGGNYSRTTLQDRFSLIGALKKPEYGGDPTLTGLTDPRITADFVTQVMEARTLAKQAEAEAKSPTLTKRADKVAGKIVRVGDNTNILRAIQQIGGLRMDLAKDLTGEKKPRTMPGVFQNKGINIDMMAMRLAEYGYPIDLNNPDDIGGMGQTAELLRRAISGDRILPMHANLEAEIEARAANEAIRQQAIIDAEPPFDADAWHASMKEASQAADLNRIAELMGEVPEDMNTAAHDADGETYSEYTSRTWDDVAYRIEQETQAETIAQAKTEADLATADAERRADAVTTRVLLKEQFAGIFGEEQAQTYMELSDTIAQWYERTTGESADEFYSRYYEDVKRSAEADIAGGLQQKVFHGSPYKFDKFTLDKIGTGEGAQAFGWGLYFADDKSIAEWYRSKLSDRTTMTVTKKDGTIIYSGDERRAPDGYTQAIKYIAMWNKKAELYYRNNYGITEDYFTTHKSEYEAKERALESERQSYPSIITDRTPEQKQRIRDIDDASYEVGQELVRIERHQNTIDAIIALQESKVDYRDADQGQLYAVDIPDDNYLLWDKPLSEQPQSAQNAMYDVVKNILEERINKADWKTGSQLSREMDATLNNLGYETGRTLYERLSTLIGDDKAASLALKEAGINGIQYLDGSSRGKGDGNYNYVIFDDSAVNILETFYQAEGQGNVKGAVVFNADGIRATIHAFESADFSTLVHENAHVFRRVLKDVAERTGNTQTIKDLATIEEWAGVKDGNWTVGAEEKFARGFEKYIATGEAPTPRLKKAFETFGKWMTSIYRTITGSAIDVKISDEVKGVFDRMLGAETKDATVKADDVLYQRNKAQVSAAQFDMFAPKPEQADMFAPQADAGATGGLLPGMQEATGMMFDVQPGSGQLTRMEAPTARSIYEIDPARTATDSTGNALSKGDIVEDADGKRHNVSGANMRGKIITEAGRILEPKEVKRVARQDNLFSLPAQPEDLFTQPEPKPISEPKVEAPGKLADFGEKLGGARKDKQQSVEKNIADADIATMTLSEIWPKSEVDNIESADMAALSQTLRDVIPAKPRDSWKLKKWVEKVKLVRELAKYANENGVDATLVKMRDFSQTLRGFVDKVDILRQMPRDKWSRIGKVENNPLAYTYVDGVKTPKPYAMAEVDGRYIQAGDLQELANVITEKLNVDVKASAMKFEIRGNGKEFFINKVGDPLYRKLITFATVEEARKYKRENAEALTQAWDKVKESDNVKETDVRRAENLPRSGKDYREGKDATPQMFDVFGFRGVEFGNWVSQGSNMKERQGMLNAAYDGLMDLADIVHIPPKALSLNGTLGLGLGSRGSGWASAHFEPDTIVINLTKTRGAGSLAHEWLHALDNYFQRKRPGAVKEKMITYQPENYYQGPGAGDKLSATRFEYLKEKGAIRNADQWKMVDGVRPEVAESFTKLVKAIDDSPMTARTELIDKGKSGGYWSSIIERAARSFEGYVIYKMAQSGYQNDYLANVQRIEDFPRDPGRYPYLLDEELAPIVDAFDNLFNTVKVDETGMLYQTAEPQPTPKAVFQQADQPFGTYEDTSQFPPHSAAMDEGYSQHVRPLLDAMKQLARDQVQSKPLDGATLDMSPEGQAALRKYMKQVQADMAGTKNAATKWGESQRDFAMLNYNKRYGIDRYMETVYPYQFFYTRSLMTWAARALDKPAIFSNYARMKKQMDRYERDIPERLRNKIKINAPWMPDWMGDALYIDPISSLFTPLNYLKPFERKLQDTNYQNIEAERILQEWAADGMASQSDIVQAVKTREGKTWERAFAEAQLRRESDLNNPMDFLNTMLGPAWYLTTPYKLLTGKGAQVGSTPILNTTRAIDTVTQGTWAEPVGDVLGMIGKPEEMLRQKLNMPEFGEYGDYYIDRQLSNMVADGLISSDEAQVAMIERKGADFETARERVKMELAMRVPTASALLAGLTAENFGQGVARAAMTAPASLFGAGLLPAGELEYRNLKQEWNEAWKLKDQGDDQAITNFFDEHPEYEAYLAKGKKPEERLRSFLVGQIWDGYMSLGATDKKQFAAEVGDVFKQSFLDSETRSIETLNVDQLAQWAQMLDRKVPDVPATQPTLTNPAPSINYFAPEITRVTDKYFTDRAKLFPNYYAYQQQYYMIPYTDKSKRLAYLTKNPEYAEYLKWQEGYYNKYPELKPVFNGQVFKRVDVSGWPPALADYVSAYAYTGSRLPNGAFKALQQEWISQGKPMGDMQTWLDSQVVPFMLYGQ